MVSFSTRFRVLSERRPKWKPFKQFPIVEINRHQAKAR